MRIAFICPDVGLDFGRTKVIHTIISNLLKMRPDYQIYLITNIESKLSLFDNLSIEKIFIPISIQKRNIFNFFRACIRLYSFLKQNKIYIAHSHHRYSDLLIFLVEKILDIKTVITVHSFLYNYKLFSYRSKHIVAVSIAVKNHLIEHFNIQSDRVAIIYNGVDKYNRHNNMTRLVQNNGTIKIICVGRFEYDKGQDILLNALKLINEFKFKIILVGKFLDIPISLGKKNEKLLKKKFLTTFIDNTRDLSDLLEIKESAFSPLEEIMMADIVVIPSRIEPFGLVAIEAGMLGKCVVASNTGGLKEIIIDGYNGLLFENGDAQNFKEKLLYLYNNRELINKFGQHLKADVENNFSSELMTMKYIKLYEEIIRKDI